jgi:hypothetical protein
MNTIPLLNPSPVRKSNARALIGEFDVFLGKKHIDTVFLTPGTTAGDVRRSLINHDGYDPRIAVIGKSYPGRKTKKNPSRVEELRRFSLSKGDSYAEADRIAKAYERDIAAGAYKTPRKRKAAKKNPSQTKLAVRALDRSRTKAKYGTKAHIPGLRYKAEGVTSSGEKVVSRAHTLSAANTSRAAHKAVKGAVTDTATGRVMTVLKAKRQHKRTGAVKKPLVALRRPAKKPSKRARK